MQLARPISARNRLGAGVGRGPQGGVAGQEHALVGVDGEDTRGQRGGTLREGGAPWGAPCAALRPAEGAGEFMTAGAAYTPLPRCRARGRLWQWRGAEVVRPAPPGPARPGGAIAQFRAAL